MKIFIVFLGLMMAFVCFINYEGELDYYEYVNMVLKEASEECASEASLAIDEEAFVTNQELIFDKAEGRRYAKKYMQDMLNNSLSIKGEEAECTLIYPDEKGGIENSVRAIVTVKTKDLFSAPFIEITEVKRESCYEYIF